MMDQNNWKSTRLNLTLFHQNKICLLHYSWINLIKFISYICTYKLRNTITMYSIKVKAIIFAREREDILSLSMSLNASTGTAGWAKKKVARLFVILTVHEQWSVRHHGCVISDIKFIMKTCLLELEPWLVYLLLINLSVNARCIKAFSNICVMLTIFVF